jgi:hypothetical protein
VIRVSGSPAMNREKMEVMIVGQQANVTESVT